jgi:hypothetical protein
MAFEITPGMRLRSFEEGASLSPLGSRPFLASADRSVGNLLPEGLLGPVGSLIQISNHTRDVGSRFRVRRHAMILFDPLGAGVIRGKRFRDIVVKEPKEVT